MNQTKKRLSIIKLAISITDIETIQLQILKLSALKTDDKIQEIIAGLRAENYAQTQALITTYIETPNEEILQRTSQAEKQLKEEEEKTLIEEFDLFVTTPETSEEEKELFDFTSLEDEDKKDEDISIKKPQSIDFDTLLNIEADNVLSDNIDINIGYTPKDTFFDEPGPYEKELEKNPIDTSLIPKDTFFDIDEDLKEKRDDRQKEGNEPIVFQEETVFFHEEGFSETMQKEPFSVQAEENTVSSYKAITYIDQKFKNMHTQYPPLEESDEHFSSVNAWLLQISNEGYNDREIEDMIEYIETLRETDQRAEAAQLLLISGATESKFAQFMLARELFKGELLQKNLPEAFTLINRLAMDHDFPEAICDLAQFYEHGIGIGKDRKKAETLYKEAMDLGIQRATSHYERVRKQNQRFFSLFKS